MPYRVKQIDYVKPQFVPMGGRAANVDPEEATKKDNALYRARSEQTRHDREHRAYSVKAMRRSGVEPFARYWPYQKTEAECLDEDGLKKWEHDGTVLYYCAAQNGDPFSSMTPARIEYGGHVFHCLEQFYQWRKAGNDIYGLGGPALRERLLAAKDGWEARRLAKAALNESLGFDLDREWKSSGRARQAMLEGMFLLYRQNGRARRRLLRTGDLYLAEAAGDLFWGLGDRYHVFIRSHREVGDQVEFWNLPGLNWHGICLMEVRTRLRREAAMEAKSGSAAVPMDRATAMMVPREAETDRPVAPSAFRGQEAPQKRRQDPENKPGPSARNDGGARAAQGNPWTEPSRIPAADRPRGDAPETKKAYAVLLTAFADTSVDDWDVEFVEEEVADGAEEAPAGSPELPRSRRRCNEDAYPATPPRAKRAHRNEWSGRSVICLGTPQASGTPETTWQDDDDSDDEPSVSDEGEWIKVEGPRRRAGAQSRPIPIQRQNGFAGHARGRGSFARSQPSHRGEGGLFGQRAGRRQSPDPFVAFM